MWRLVGGHDRDAVPRLRECQGGQFVAHCPQLSTVKDGSMGMMRHAFVAAVLMVAVITGTALAEEQGIALVIGNSAYGVRPCFA